jgi:hypothetical protein
LSKAIKFSLKLFVRMQISNMIRLNSSSYRRKNVAIPVLVYERKLSDSSLE